MYGRQGGYGNQQQQQSPYGQQQQHSPYGQQQQQRPPYGSPQYPPQQQGGYQPSSNYGSGSAPAPTPNGPASYPPRHAGIGAPGQAAHLPAPQNLASQVGTGEKYTLFVGSIPTLGEGWLDRILGTAGTVLSLKRPTPAFAFVDFEDAESTLRCLEAINGVKVVGPDGVVPEKGLLIKADEKMRGRLDEFELARGARDETSKAYLQRTVDDLADLLTSIASGAAPSTSSTTNPRGGPPPGSSQRSSTYLQDLAPEDLPENQRGVITGEIAMFRERAAKKAAEKKKQEEARREAMLKGASGGGGQNGGGGGGGWGARAAQAAQAQAQARGAGGVDPQSYNKPIGFVGSSGAGAAGSPPRGGPAAEEVKEALPGEGDEQRELERLARERREQEALYRDTERRLENRERGRVQAVERERAREASIQDQEVRERTNMRERLALYDDDKEKDHGRDLFYSDRSRWRAQRRTLRAREVEADSRDRAAEAAHLAALQKQSEDFLSSQADLFSTLGGNKPASVLKEDEPLVKLSLGLTNTVKKEPAPVVKKSLVLGGGEDEEEGKKKRVLVPLTYDDVGTGEEEMGTGAIAAGRKLTPMEKERKRQEVLERIPVTKESLWAHKMLWSSLDEHIIRTKISPLAVKNIVALLGDEEDELLNAVLDHVRAHKGAAELVEELEPVLDDDATEFVRKIWKELAFDLACAHAGLA